MIIRDPSEVRVLMVGRAAGHQCVYCGETLAADIQVVRGRICRACLPADSPTVMRMAAAMHVEIPGMVDHPWRFKREITVKNSYWLLEEVFGSLSLLRK